MTDELPQRRRPAHPPPVRCHNRPVIIFLTVCSKERGDVFANPAVHQALQSAWSELNHWIVGYYLIMPDHIHLFCAPGTAELHAIVNWTSRWKRRVSSQCPHLQSGWLANCWDTQMRTQEIFRQKLEYVRNNPIRAGLVAESSSWPYQGVLNDLVWIT